jgi:hypothetical protein
LLRFVISLTGDDLRRSLIATGLVLAGCTCFAAGCADESGEAEPSWPGRCAAPDGVNDAPRTIEEAMLLADSLPKPLTVSCYVESLARPMTVIGSNDFISAQPAGGPEAPRIFAIYDELIISFVPDGAGSKVLEFAEERPLGLSVKAELKMPVDGAITPDLPFEHILEDGGTSCGSCHQFEEPDPTIDYAEAYASEAIRPSLSMTVRHDKLAELAAQCDGEATPRRCDIFDAMFYRGDVEDGDFPRPLPTIYD